MKRVYTAMLVVAVAMGLAAPLSASSSTSPQGETHRVFSSHEEFYAFEQNISVEEAEVRLTRQGELVFAIESARRAIGDDRLAGT